MSSQGKYIYGIIEEPQPRRFSFSGVGGSEVYTINNHELAAVVSDIQPGEIDPTRKNVQAHTIVQDELLKEYVLLPMGFGMIAGSREEVLSLLEKNHRSLLSELERLAARVEVELKVFWDQKAVIQELQGNSQELTRLKARISAASSPREAQRLLVETGQRVERIILDWKENHAQVIYQTLMGLSVQSRLNKTAGIQNILNASFLIDKGNQSQFQAEVYRLDAQYQGKLNFKYVGPLPPYNFIDLKLEPARW